MSIANLSGMAFRAARCAFGRPARPYKLTLVATERCNLRCLGCRIWESEGRDLPLHDIRALFARSGYLSWVDVTGGEIFLREDLPEVFEAILRNVRQLAFLHFPTNGFLTDRIVAMTREIVRARPSCRLVVTVSLDGPRDAHDLLRGVPGSFDRAVETFARLRELPGCRTYLGMTLSDGNRERVDEMLSGLRTLFPRLSADDLHVNLFHRSPHYYRNLSVPPPGPEGMIRTMRAIRRRKGWRGGLLGLVERRYLALGERYIRGGGSPLPCRALSAGCFVGADGTVYPCVSWDRPLGRIAEAGHDLETIWNSAAAREARKLIAAARCPGCWTPCEATPAIAARWWRLCS